MSKQKDNNWLNKAVIGTLLVLLALSGCGKNDKSALTDAEVERFAVIQEPKNVETLMVGGEMITCEEIIQLPLERNGNLTSVGKLLEPLAKTNTLEQFKEKARPQVQQAVMGRISNILLYQKAKREAPDKIDEAIEKAVDKEWKKFVLRFEGNEAKANDELAKMGMNRRSFREYQKKTILTQSYISSKLSENMVITHRQLIENYNQMKDEFFLIPALLTFRLIDIEPAKLQVVDPNQDKREQAIWLAMDLLRRIEAGEDFGELAKQYSHGHRSEFGGLWNPRHPDSLAKPYDMLAAEAKKMKPGQIAGPIEVEGHIFIMKLEEKRDKGYEPLEKVQAQVERKIITDRRKEVFDKLESELKQQAKLGDTSLFVEVCLDKIYRNSNQ